MCVLPKGSLCLLLSYLENWALTPYAASYQPLGSFSLVPWHLSSCPCPHSPWRHYHGFCLCSCSFEDVKFLYDWSTPLWKKIWQKPLVNNWATHSLQPHRSSGGQGGTLALLWVFSLKKETDDSQDPEGLWDQTSGLT